MRGTPGAVFSVFVFDSNMGALAWVRWGIVASFLGEYGREAPGGAVSSILRVAVVASVGRGLALVVDFLGGIRGVLLAPSRERGPLLPVGW